MSAMTTSGLLGVGFPQYLFRSFFDFFVCHSHADVRLLARTLRKNVGTEMPNWLAISAPVKLATLPQRAYLLVLLSDGFDLMTLFSM
jgi:hypothetical protein